LTLGRPPSLSVLIARMGEAEDYERFVALVRELLPEREQEILGWLSPNEQIAAFASHFEDRYFPLQDRLRGLADGYSDVTRGIPVIPLGISCDDYHLMASDWRLGLQLMTYLLAAPNWTDNAARVPIGEACAEDVPEDLLRRVPEGGFPREAARLLRGTPHEGLAHWADMLECDTGNYFLDLSGEYWWEDMLDWEKGVVEALTQEWRQAEAIHAKAIALAKWLEEDPPAHFQELLNFIEGRQHEGLGIPPASGAEGISLPRLP